MRNVSGGHAGNRGHASYDGQASYQDAAGYAGTGSHDDDPAVPYSGAVPGTPVLSSTGNEIGTLEHVLEVSELGLFDGIVVATDWGLRFIVADQVEVITIRHVRCRMNDAEASRLAPPDGSPVYRVNVL
jgi:hypothetical protein